VQRGRHLAEDGRQLPQGGRVRPLDLAGLDLLDRLERNARGMGQLVCDRPAAVRRCFRVGIEVRDFWIGHKYAIPIPPRQCPSGGDLVSVARLPDRMPSACAVPLSTLRAWVSVAKGFILQEASQVERCRLRLPPPAGLSWSPDHGL
jgi:hypothetical protein